MFRKRSASKPHCSFCNRAEDAAGELISSPINEQLKPPPDYFVYICADCIAMCNQLLSDRRAEADGTMLVEASRISEPSLASAEELRKTLNQFYRDQGIAVDHFTCPKSERCEAAADHRLTGGGSEAHVGSLYGDPMKIVIVSLDRGEGADNVWSRTKSIENLPLEDGRLNPHMRGTRQTLAAIIGDCSDIWKRFAMINAAKCCLGNGMRMAPDALYWECSDFGIGELKLLGPEIVVTQGKNARALLSLRKKCLPEKARAVVDGFLAQCSLPEVRGSIDAMVEAHIHEADLGGETCFWLDTPHPSDQGGRWHSFKRVILPVLGRILTQLRFKDGRSPGI